MKNKTSEPLVSNLSFKIDMTEFKGLVTRLLPRPTRFCNLHNLEKMFMTMCRISLFQAKQYQTWTSATSQKIWKKFQFTSSARVWLMATIILSSLVIFFRMEPQKLKVQNNQSWCLFIVLIRFCPFADWYQEDIKKPWQLLITSTLSLTLGWKLHVLMKCLWKPRQSLSLMKNK